MCGGAITFALHVMRVLGLSPRVRGSLRVKLDDNAVIRSIPACAGEPRRRHSRPRLAGVYPRVCGGAVDPRPSHRAGGGLSPRVRGSPRRFARSRNVARSIPACAGEPGWPGLARGSIPACAGEPKRLGSWGLRRWVYPRVCGGAVMAHVTLDRISGLSPRVRGSLVNGTQSTGAGRSIPACAGEPFL